jgi:XTP/dITP diphosphohydrolase
MKLVFATNNQHKLSEVAQIIDNKFQLLALKDIGCTDEIPETKDTIEENAFEKAYYIYNKYQINCFADDTGLEIDALNGEPGVFSARYAGPACNFDDNIDKVLMKLNGINNRKAIFKTVIALIINGKEYRFSGIVEGVILTERKGNSGFGYDPIFLPDGHSLTYAQMNAETKNAISHRGIATRQLCSFLNSL